MGVRSSVVGDSSVMAVGGRRGDDPVSLHVGRPGHDILYRRLPVHLGAPCRARRRRQGARDDLIGKFARESGDQVTYNGHKLYNFAGDGIPGEAFGQGFGRTWFVVSPEGEQIIIGVDPMTTTK